MKNKNWIQAFSIAGVVGFAVFGSGSAQAALHCEEQVNRVLTIYESVDRTRVLSRPINAGDIQKTRRAEMPSAKDLSASYSSRPYPVAVRFDGLRSDQFKDEVKVIVYAVRQNPKASTGSGQSVWTSEHPDLQVTFRPNCKLKEFRVTDLPESQGGQISVLVSAETCKKIFQDSHTQPKPKIVAWLKTQRGFEGAPLQRVVDNCAQRSSGSDDPQHFAPVLVQLLGTEAEVRSWHRTSQSAPVSSGSLRTGK